MDQWESFVDEQIRRVIGDGNSAHLPGAGKPLRLDADDTPSDMRLAYKIMRDNNITPDWIAIGRDLEVERERIIAQLAAAYRQYKGRLADARRSNSAFAQQQAEAFWDGDQRILAEAITAYNKTLRDYNLKIPAGVAQRPPLILSDLLKRL